MAYHPTTPAYNPRYHHNCFSLIVIVIPGAHKQYNNSIIVIIIITVPYVYSVYPGIYGTPTWLQYTLSKLYNNLIIVKGLSLSASLQAWQTKQGNKGNVRAHVGITKVNQFSTHAVAPPISFHAMSPAGQ